MDSRYVFVVQEENISYDSNGINIDSIWSSKEKAEDRYQELKRDEPNRSWDIESFLLDDVNG